MRLYDNCIEMLDETYREIWKRGQTIFDSTVQGKVVDIKDFERKEILFYNFRVDNFEDLKAMLDKARDKFGKQHHTMEAAETWFKDMTENDTLTEKWWQLTDYTKKYFQDFCDEGNGCASYSYGERIMPQLPFLFEKLKKNKYSTGAIITMPTPDDIKMIGRRVPCTTAYHFICRPTLQGDKLNLIILQRSCDAINFFPLDFAKAVFFLKYIAKKTELGVGTITMSINSLHVYARDVLEEYKW